MLLEARYENGTQNGTQNGNQIYFFFTARAAFILEDASQIDLFFQLVANRDE